MGCCTAQIRDADAEDGADLPYFRSGRGSSWLGYREECLGKGTSVRGKKLRELSLCAEQGVAAGSRRMGQRSRAEEGFCAKIILVSAHRFQRRAEKRAGGASGSCLTCPRCERGGSREGACVHIPVCRVSLPPFPRVPALAGNVISS